MIKYCLVGTLLLMGCWLNTENKPLELPPYDLTSGHHWWKDFNNDHLNALVDDLAQSNPDVRDISWRIQESRSRSRQVRADRMPQVTLNYEDGEQRQSRFIGGRDFLGSGKHFHSSETRVDLSFELDLWDRLKKTEKLSQIDVRQQILDRDGLFQSLVSDLIITWLNLIADKMKLNIYQERLLLVDQKKKIIEGRVQSGAATKKELYQVLNEYQQEKRRFETFQMSVVFKRDSLKMLINSPEDNWYLNEENLPHDPWQDVIIPIDSQTIQGRPDLKQAALEVKRAHLDIDLAKINFLPQFTITGSAGYRAKRIETLMRPDHSLWSLMGNLAQPLYSGGRNKAKLKETRLALGRIEESYQTTLRRALNELKQSLMRIENAKAQYQISQQSFKQSVDETSYDLQRYKMGGLPKITYISNKIKNLRFKEDIINTRLTLLIEKITLARVAGWN